jgi:hypothetical protein
MFVFSDLTIPLSQVPNICAILRGHYIESHVYNLPNDFCERAVDIKKSVV